MDKMLFWDYEYFQVLKLLHKLEGRTKKVFDLLCDFSPLFIHDLNNIIIQEKEKNHGYDDLDEAIRNSSWDFLETAIDGLKTEQPDNANLTRLLARLELNQGQAGILKILYLFDEYEYLNMFLEDLTDSKKMAFLRDYTGLSIDEIISVMGRKGFFFCKGLATDDYAIAFCIRFYKINISIDRYIYEYIGDNNIKTPSSCLKAVDNTNPLPLSEYDIPQETIISAQTVLSKEGRSLVFLYGNSGTGKTELAKSLAHSVKRRPFFLVKQEGIDMRSISRFLTGVTLLDQESDILIVDEAENFLTSDSSSSAAEKSFAGLMKDFLGSFSGKMIFITNDLPSIPGPILKMMSLTIKLPDYNFKQRLGLWNRLDQDLQLFSSDEKKQLSEEYESNPDSIQKAYTVCRDLAAADQSRELIFKAAADILARHDELFKDTPHKSRKRVNQIDPSVINSSLPADDLISAVSQWSEKSKTTNHCLTFLFYGPPGTGKTEFAQFLAQISGLPCTTKRASDLISPFVGESEKKIRTAFSEANGGILIIDEADSFLYNRDNITHNWERVQVNEFLTQMEHFRGILFATTNAHDILDKASLRRFHFKVEFGVTQPEKIPALFRHFFRDYDLDDSALNRLRQLTKITPGDFSAVHQQLFYCGDKSVERILDSLEEECRHRIVRAVGF